jgi:hypothetical protein
VGASRHRRVDGRPAVAALRERGAKAKRLAAQVYQFKTELLRCPALILDRGASPPLKFLPPARESERILKDCARWSVLAAPDHRWDHLDALLRGGARSFWASAPFPKEEPSIVISFAPEVLVCLNNYRIASGNGQRSPYLRGWRLEGRMTGEEWELLDEADGTAMLADGQEHTFAVDRRFVSEIRLSAIGRNGIGRPQMHLTAFDLGGRFYEEEETEETEKPKAEGRKTGEPPAPDSVGATEERLFVSGELRLFAADELHELGDIDARDRFSVLRRVRVDGEGGGRSFIGEYFGACPRPGPISTFVERIGGICRLGHPHILPIVGAVPPTRDTPLVLLYRDDGLLPLTDVLKRDAGEMSVALLSGLIHLESKGLAHRHLRPSNLFVDRRGSIQICGYAAGRLADLQLITEDRDTQRDAAYCAPELSGSQPIDGSKMDVFAFAIILFEMITGRRACAEPPDCTCVEFLLQGKRPRIPQSVCARLRDVIEKGWAHDPGQRPTLGQLWDQMREVEPRA